MLYYVKNTVNYQENANLFHKNPAKGLIKRNVLSYPEG
jgi:hypothetical protein